MAKIAIYYHTGAGSTGMIGEILKELLSDRHDVDIVRVDNSYDYKKVSSYDFLIFGYPVYGFNVSDSMRESSARFARNSKLLPRWLSSSPNNSR